VITGGFQCDLSLMGSISVSQLCLKPQPEFLLPYVPLQVLCLLFALLVIQLDIAMPRGKTAQGSTLLYVPRLLINEFATQVNTFSV